MQATLCQREVDIRLRKYNARHYVNLFQVDIMFDSL